MDDQKNSTREYRGNVLLSRTTEYFHLIRKTSVSIGIFSELFSGRFIFMEISNF